MLSGKAHFAAVLSIGAGALFLGIAASGSVKAQASYEVEPRDPQFIYDRTCGYCHGHNVGPIILGRNLAPQVITYFVRNGNGAMPAFKPTEITDTELEALASWIAASEADQTEHGQ